MKLANMNEEAEILHSNGEYWENWESLDEQTERYEPNKGIIYDSESVDYKSNDSFEIPDRYMPCNRTTVDKLAEESEDSEGDKYEWDLDFVQCQYEDVFTNDSSSLSEEEDGSDEMEITIDEDAVLSSNHEDNHEESCQSMVSSFNYKDSDGEKPIDITEEIAETLAEKLSKYFNKDFLLKIIEHLHAAVVNGKIPGKQRKKAESRYMRAIKRKIKKRSGKTLINVSSLIKQTKVEENNEGQAVVNTYLSDKCLAKSNDRSYTMLKDYSNSKIKEQGSRKRTARSFDTSTAKSCVKSVSKNPTKIKNDPCIFNLDKGEPQTAPYYDIIPEDCSHSNTKFLKVSTGVVSEGKYDPTQVQVVQTKPIRHSTSSQKQSSKENATQNSYQVLQGIDAKKIWKKWTKGHSTEILPKPRCQKHLTLQFMLQTIEKEMHVKIAFSQKGMLFHFTTEVKPPEDCRTFDEILIQCAFIGFHAVRIPVFRRFHIKDDAENISTHQNKICRLRHEFRVSEADLLVFLTNIGQFIAQPQVNTTSKTPLENVARNKTKMINRNIALGHECRCKQNFDTKLATNKTSNSANSFIYNGNQERFAENYKQNHGTSNVVLVQKIAISSEQPCLKILENRTEYLTNIDVDSFGLNMGKTWKYQSSPCNAISPRLVRAQTTSTCKFPDYQINIENVGHNQWRRESVTKSLELFPQKTAGQNDRIKVYKQNYLTTITITEKLLPANLLETRKQMYRELGKLFHILMNRLDIFVSVFERKFSVLTLLDTGNFNIYPKHTLQWIPDTDMAFSVITARKAQLSSTHQSDFTRKVCQGTGSLCLPGQLFSTKTNILYPTVQSENLSDLVDCSKPRNHNKLKPDQHDMENFIVLEREAENIVSNTTPKSTLSMRLRRKKQILLENKNRLMNDGRYKKFPGQIRTKARPSWNFYSNLKVKEKRSLTTRNYRQYITNKTATRLNLISFLRMKKLNTPYDTLLSNRTHVKPVYVVRRKTSNKPNVCQRDQNLKRRTREKVKPMNSYLKTQQPQVSSQLPRANNFQRKCNRDIRPTQPEYFHCLGWRKVAFREKKTRDHKHSFLFTDTKGLRRQRNPSEVIELSKVHQTAMTRHITNNFTREESLQDAGITDHAVKYCSSKLQSDEDDDIHYADGREIQSVGDSRINPECSTADDQNVGKMCISATGVEPLTFEQCSNTHQITTPMGIIATGVDTLPNQQSSCTDGHTKIFTSNVENKNIRNCFDTRYRREKHIGIIATGFEIENQHCRRACRQNEGYKESATTKIDDVNLHHCLSSTRQKEDDKRIRTTGIGITEVYQRTGATDLRQVPLEIFSNNVDNMSIKRNPRQNNQLKIPDLEDIPIQQRFRARNQSEKSPGITPTGIENIPIQQFSRNVEQQSGCLGVQHCSRQPFRPLEQPSLEQEGTWCICPSGSQRRSSPYDNKIEFRLGLDVPADGATNKELELYNTCCIDGFLIMIFIVLHFDPVLRKEFQEAQNDLHKIFYEIWRAYKNREFSHGKIAWCKFGNLLSDGCTRKNMTGTERHLIYRCFQRNRLRVESNCTNMECPCSHIKTSEYQNVITLWQAQGKSLGDNVKEAIASYLKRNLGPCGNGGLCGGSRTRKITTPPHLLPVDLFNMQFDSVKYVSSDLPEEIKIHDGLIYELVQVRFYIDLKSHFVDKLKVPERTVQMRHHWTIYDNKEGKLCYFDRDPDSSSLSSCFYIKKSGNFN